MEFFWNIFPNKIVQGSFSTAAGKKVDQQDKRKKDTQETKKKTSDSCTKIMWTCLSGKKVKTNFTLSENRTWQVSRFTMIACSGGPDLQIRWGPGHPDPEIRGAAVSKKCFSALQASVWSNIKGGGPPGALPWIHHWPVNTCPSLLAPPH